MREVDTGALLDVAPFLGIGNPSTALGHVLFDDETLQQVLNVYPLVAKRNGFYVEATSSIDPGAGATVRSATPLGDLFSLGFLELAQEFLGVSNRFQVDVYLVRIHAQIAVPDVSNLDEVQLGVRLDDGGRLYGGDSLTLFVSNAIVNTAAPLTSDGQTDLLINAELGHLQGPPILPMQLPNASGGESELLLTSTAAAGGGLETFARWGLWICRKGVPLTFAV